jgi:VWFA-related protein
MRRLTILFQFLGAPLVLLAQQTGQLAPASAGQPIPVFRAESNLVTVHFQYTPKKGLADLSAENVELREDGVPQKLAILQGGQTNPQTAPLEVNLLFAYLRASPEQIIPPWLRQAKFELAALDDRQRVSVAIWTVGNGLRRLCGPTRDAAQLNRGLDGIANVWATSPDNDTTLLESIGALVPQAAKGRTGVNRIVVVLTREEIDHQYGGPEVVSAAQENGISIFPITVGLTAGGTSDSPYSADTSPSVSTATRYSELYSTPAKRRESPIIVNGGLSWLAKATNGQRWDLNSTNPKVLWEKLFQQVGERIRNDYVIGYYPAETGQSKLRKVQLSLKNGASGQITPKELYVRR